MFRDRYPMQQGTHELESEATRHEPTIGHGKIELSMADGVASGIDKLARYLHAGSVVLGEGTA